MTLRVLRMGFPMTGSVKKCSVKPNLAFRNKTLELLGHLSPVLHNKHESTYTGPRNAL